MPRSGRKHAKPTVITLADRARDQGQWELAAGYYREALHRSPHNPPIWVQYGHVLKEFGRLPEAERAYRTALAYDPRNADSQLQLGHVLKIQGKKEEEARAAYLRAYALDPSLDGASFELAQLGWSESHFFELRGMLGEGDPMALDSVNVTSAENSLISAVHAQPAGLRQGEFTSHGSPEKPPTVMVESSGHITSPPPDPAESEDARLVSQSGIFDSAWYVEKHIVARDGALDPILHYLRYGAKEGRDPHPLFDTDWYLATNPDVAATGVNPLVHYLRYGAAEGRAPNPLLGYVLTGASERRVPPTARPEVYVPDLFELRGLKPRGAIAVVLHLYYPDLWDEMRQTIQRISHPFDLFVSLVKGTSEQLRTSVTHAFPNAYVFEFENRGRDIGPFLVLLQSGVLFHYELVCKLHTKRSPHRPDGDEWRGALLGGVLGSSRQIDQIVSSFRSDPDLGMVVADGNIYYGHKHWVSNEKLLAELLPQLGISTDVKDRTFPGGSIFWIRPLLLRTLAGARLNINDFEPEPVTADGSLPHAVERMFGLICEDAGMRVVESSRVTDTIKQPTGRLSRVHIIAFYLPQFHPIQENDTWWGKGFTEWANVTRAKPLFAGHRQPRLPSDLGFYDLRVPEVREAQAELASRYGLTAFCYYYYWFNGRRVLERPLDEVLASGKPDFPFLICWANEPWTRNWDGLNRDVLLPQTYEQGWTRRFARDIAPLLRDQRYFRIDGKPMLLIYRIGHVPKAGTAIRELRAALSDEGIPEVHLAAAWVWFPEEQLPTDPGILGLDAYFEFPPHYLASQPLRPSPPGLHQGFTGDLFDYDSTVRTALAGLDEPTEGRRHRGVMLAWDSTPRHDTRAHIWQGATPANFRRWLRGTIIHERQKDGDRVVFINAWNEWAEGTYLEPDRDFGCGWLEALASAADVEWPKTQPADDGQSDAQPLVGFKVERRGTNARIGMPYLEIDGFCPICQRDAHFRAHDKWLRDFFLCDGCGSIPRERAFFSVIEMLTPSWRDLQIHETSPSIRAASLKLKTECPGYSYSYYNEEVALGSVHQNEGYRCENIEGMMFGDESFNLFLSQDVFEHIFHPDRAIKEIERVLKPGGAYIMTVPLVKKSSTSERRARVEANGNIMYIGDAQYHGNPIDQRGALVTIEWGYDILDYLSYHSSLQCGMIHIDDLSRGIRAEFIEVIVCRKGAVPSL